MKNKSLYRLKDITLPYFIMTDPRYEIPYRAHNEPRDHYLFKTYLGYNLRQYVNYNTNFIINDHIMDHPFFRHLNTSMVRFEFPHIGVTVTKKNELSRTFKLSDMDLNNGLKYFYHSDIAWIIDWQGHKYHIFIEINGGIHTKNPEQKQNNRMRYIAISNHYRSYKPDTKMIMIVFESDEYKYNKMDYFINIIINTILDNKIKYPEIFLFELQ